ncbi:MAG: ABC transporter substrate-binding protein [Phycisphaeraceae bacterium]|nr:ABC transporter substrate-binding protein [Phycisphaeraceae bacterium]
MRRVAPLALPILIVVVVLLAHRWWWSGAADALVVYCAHDSIFSRSIIDDFEAQSGLEVDLRLDNEATKSLALTERLIAERDRPVCDVLWNNQWLGTADLAERGVLAPYRGPGYERIPARFRDAEGRFAGFAARFRVYIVNTGQMPADAASVETALKGDLSRLAVARPLWGTTLSHYAVLWAQYGGDWVRTWRDDWQRRGVVERGSNGTVKSLVADGTCRLGLTDTDDFFVALDAGAPVDMVPVRIEERYVCIPNTVAIVAGTRRLDRAQRFVDYLLSEHVEMLLARGPARQVPLGPVDDAALPDQVRRMRSWVDFAHDLRPMTAARGEALAWLKAELLR